MNETKMNVDLLAHTKISDKLIWHLARQKVVETYDDDKTIFWSLDDKNNYDVNTNFTSGQAILLTAIRTCYSPNKPSKILDKEGGKYFNNDKERFNKLFERIFSSKHSSVLEHISFTFAVEGVSRSLLAQLTRHRHASFSVQSQRYLSLDTDGRAGGIEYIIPKRVKENTKQVADGDTDDDYFVEFNPSEYFYFAMLDAQNAYDKLREAGVPAEDARFVLPNATATNLVMTMNLRSIFEFYSKRQRSKGAQWEIAELAERIRKEVVKVEPWLEKYFDKIKK